MIFEYYWLVLSAAFAFWSPNQGGRRGIHITMGKEITMQYTFVSNMYKYKYTIIQKYVLSTLM